MDILQSLNQGIFIVCLLTFFRSLSKYFYVFRLFITPVVNRLLGLVF